MRNLFSLDYQSSAFISSQTVSQINTNVSNIIIAYESSKIDESTCKMLLQNDLDSLTYLKEHLPLELKKTVENIIHRIKNYISKLNICEKEK